MSEKKRLTKPLIALARWMFFILGDNWKTLFFNKNLALPRGLVQPPCCYVLWNKCFERSQFYVRYLHKNITMLLLNIKSPKQSFQLLNFLKNLYLLIAFLIHSFISTMFLIFLCKHFSFLIFKSSVEVCFLLGAVIKFLWRVSVFTNCF